MFLPAFSLDYCFLVVNRASHIHRLLTDCTGNNQCNFDLCIASKSGGTVFNDLYYVIYHNTSLVTLHLILYLAVLHRLYMQWCTGRRCLNHSRTILGSMSCLITYTLYDCGVHYENLWCQYSWVVMPHCVILTNLII